MTKKKHISDSLIVVIPAYNEEQNVEACVQIWTEQLEKTCPGQYTIKIYNDGSKDRTEDILKDLENRFPNLAAEKHTNRGHGPTILRGYREASQSADWIFQCDSDNEISPKYFEELWQQKEDYDFLIGRRCQRKSEWWRKILSLGSRILVYTLYGKKVRDVNSPFRLMRSEVFQECFNQIDDDTFAPNILVSSYCSKIESIRVLETETLHQPRVFGEASIKIKKFLKIALKCFLDVIKFRLIRRSE